MPLTVEEAIPGKRVRVIRAPQRTGKIAAAPAERPEGWTVRVIFDDGTTTTMRLANLESIPDVANPFEELNRGSFHGVLGLRRNILHEKLHGRLLGWCCFVNPNEMHMIYLCLTRGPVNSRSSFRAVGAG
jgi:hypothetical protein